MQNELKPAGRLIVESLEAAGVNRLFCVPGESYLPVLDALVDSAIEATVCRQEGGAAMMAEAWGKLTGEPGICFVTRGPGATNAASGIHVAEQDSTPMILFVGQIDSACRHREAFQEVDYRALFGNMAKWVAEIDTADRIPELVSRAFQVARAGRPGPVVLVLPEDMLAMTAASATFEQPAALETHPSLQDVQQCIAMLNAAESPMAIVGGSRWSASAIEQFSQFAESIDLPVACSFRRQMLFDHTHPCYAGDVGLGINPKLKARLENADVLLLLGCRLPEIPSQNYTLLNIPVPVQTVIHVHPGAEELGKVYQPALAIHASPTSFCQALTDHSVDAQQTPQRITDAHSDYLSWSAVEQAHPDAKMMKAVMQALHEQLPEDAIITNGAGNYATWIHRFWRFRSYGSQLAPTSGSMGYGVPAAVAGKLCCPERVVVAMAGDGCFQMTGQELGTAMQANAAIIIIVIDNGMYGTIRMHQERDYPHRISATELMNPDFARLAEAYGAFGAKVESPEQFASALSTALTLDRPSLLHVKVESSVITPTQSLSDLHK